MSGTVRLCRSSVFVPVGIDQFLDYFFICDTLRHCHMRNIILYDESDGTLTSGWNYAEICADVCRDPHVAP